MPAISPAFFWVLLALVALVVEGVLAGSFVAIFCALGAVATALFTSLSLLPSIWQQGSCFAGCTLLSVALARTPLLAWAQAKAKEYPLAPVVGERARVVVAMDPGATGEVSLHGAMWRALNDDSVALPAHCFCHVQSIDGLVVHVVRTPTLSPTSMSL